jgi:anti-sigma factor RsiW
MSDMCQCDDKEQLLAYVYDELDGLTRRRLDEHLRICAACTAEVAGLSGVRRELADWLPPDADLGFAIAPATTVVRRAEVQAAAPWWASRVVPAWAQAAAAVLVVAAGLSIANLQVRYGADGLVVTTGWMAPAGPAAVPAGGQGPADWGPAFAALESALRDEIQTVRAGSVAAAAPSTPNTALTPQRVVQLIEQSERRQQQELALRLTQFGRDLEMQRRTDLVRINQGFGQFEGRAGAEIARQRQMLDYIMRVSSQPPPQ